MASYKNIFKITHNDVLPIQGSILIAEPFLQDAYFQRSVVLLIEHTEHGSMGFVLNKKTDLIVNSFFKEFAEFPEIPIYLGGPVSPNRLFFIHSLGARFTHYSFRPISCWIRKRSLNACIPPYAICFHWLRQ